MFIALLNELAEKSTVQFYVRARPGMPSTKALSLMEDESIKIDIAAAPEGGKANAELIKYLSKEFGVTKDQIKIVSGATTRHKLLRITNH
jgi:uncharacterized protein (TIGR00251 family)